MNIFLNRFRQMQGMDPKIYLMMTKLKKDERQKDNMKITKKRTKMIKTKKNILKKTVSGHGPEDLPHDDEAQKRRTTER